MTEVVVVKNTNIKTKSNRRMKFFCNQRGGYCVHQAYYAEDEL